jgi:hypothetical protein
MTQATATTLPFGEWQPDLAAVNRPSSMARNVIADQDGYRVMPQPVLIGPTGLPAGATALTQFTSPGGIVYTFAGTPTRLYRATLAGWEDVTRASSVYDALTPWRFARYGGRVYAVNGRDIIQRFELEGGVRFEDVPAATFGARYIAIVRDFVMVAYIVEDLGNTSWPYTVGWSGLARPEDWTPSARTQADRRDVPGVGEITGLTGGEWGTIIGRVGWQRIDFVGPPERMANRVLEEGVSGCDVPGSVIKAGSRSIWLGSHGWRMTTGGPTAPIGLGRVDQHTRRRMVDDTSMQVTLLPVDRAVLWSYRSRDAVGAGNDEVLCYAWEAGQAGRWTDGRMRVEVLGQGATPARFTDDPDHSSDFMDEPPWADRLTDDPSLSGGLPFAAALRDGALHALQPVDSNVATLETGEAQLIPGRRATMLRARPVVDGWSGPGALKVEVGARDRQEDPLSATAQLPAEPSGSHACRKSGRWHRLRAYVPGRFERAVGIQAAAVVSGTR